MKFRFFKNAKKICRDLPVDLSFTLEISNQQGDFVKFLWLSQNIWTLLGNIFLWYLIFTYFPMNESCVVYGNSLVGTMNIETKNREKGWCSVLHRSKSDTMRTKKKIKVAIVFFSHFFYLKKDLLQFQSLNYWKMWKESLTAALFWSLSLPQSHNKQLHLYRW